MGMGADPQNRILLDPRWLHIITFPESCDGRDGIASIIEGMIVSQFHATAQEGADYVIILGAQWKTSGPSYVLQKRLDKAIEYLNANPETKVIVSGGQGYNEPISEAEGMQGYLKPPGSIRSGSSWRMLPRIPRRI